MRDLMGIRNKFMLYAFIMVSSCVKQVPNYQTQLENYNKDEVDIFIENSTKNQSLTSLKEIGSVQYRLNYVPNDVEALKRTDYEKMNNDSIENYINEFRSNYKGVYFFTLYISNKSGEDCIKLLASENRSYEDLIKYCSFGINNDFYAVKGNDTLACIAANFERTYGLSKDIRFNLSFRGDKTMADNKVNDLSLVYEDNLFKNGIIKFRFD